MRLNSNHLASILAGAGLAAPGLTFGAWAFRDMPEGIALMDRPGLTLSFLLLLIAPVVSDRDLERAWFYVPRMLRDHSAVLREQHDPETRPIFVKLSASELAERAGRFAPRRVA